MCCSHVPARSTICRRNASWWFVTAVSTDRTSSSVTPGLSRRIRGTHHRPRSRSPCSRKYAIFGGTGGFDLADRAGKPVGSVPGGERGRQRGHALVFEEVLRRYVQTLLGQVRRDSDGAHRVATELEEVGVAVDRGDTQRLRPDALQRRFDVLLPAAARGAFGRTVGRGGRRRGVGGDGPVRLRRVRLGIDPMPLARERISGERDQSWPIDRSRSGDQSTSTSADQSCPRASRKVSWSSRFWSWWRMSRTALCRLDHRG